MPWPYHTMPCLSQDKNDSGLQRQSSPVRYKEFQSGPSGQCCEQLPTLRCSTARTQKLGVHAPKQLSACSVAATGWKGVEGSSRKGRKGRLLEDDAVMDFTCSATHCLRKSS